jgi:hypothetical protein
VGRFFEGEGGHLKSAFGEVGGEVGVGEGFDGGEESASCRIQLDAGFALSVGGTGFGWGRKLSFKAFGFIGT